MVLTKVMIFSAQKILKILFTDFFFGWAYVTSVLTVYLCLYYNQQQHILFPSYFFNKTCKSKLAISIDSGSVRITARLFLVMETFRKCVTVNPPFVFTDAFTCMSKTCITFSFSAITSFTNTFHAIVMINFNIRFPFFSSALLLYTVVLTSTTPITTIFVSFFNVGSSE